MASSSRKSYSAASNTRQPSKRARYCGSFKYRNRHKVSQPFLGFEDQKLKPVLRSSLDLDTRFFPFGIQPSTIVEIKGPEKSGKTFMLTYFISRMMTVYPDKKAILIDTRHKFNVKNYLSIVSHFDKELKNLKSKLNQPISTLVNLFPKINNYLDRVLVIKCYSAEDLMLTLGPTGESNLANMLLQDPKFSLVAIDSIDNFSYAESLQALTTQQEKPNLMQYLKESVSSTRCPVICSTLLPTEKHEYRKKKITARLPGNESQQSSKEGNNDNIPTSTDLPVQPQPQLAFDEQEDEALASNIPIDYTCFSNIFEIVPASEAEKARIVHSQANKITHYASAYLRSRHSANTAGSGGNQRVKFSIFSDMLWVDEM